MTLTPPTGAGYFWWTDGGEHTPTILKVRRGGLSLYADNGEYTFAVGESPQVRETPEYEDEGPVFAHEGKEYYFGTYLWSESPIELPEINGEFVQPDSF